MEIQKTSNSQSYLEKEEWNCRNQPTWLQALLITTLNPINIQLLQLLPSKWKSITQISEVLSLGLIYPKHARPAKSWSRRQAFIIAFFCPLVDKKTKKKKKKSLMWKNVPFSNWSATYCNVYKFEIHSSLDLYICKTLF